MTNRYKSVILAYNFGPKMGRRRHGPGPEALGTGRLGLTGGFRLRTGPG
jgi:hypothetical protein